MSCINRLDPNTIGQGRAASTPEAKAYNYCKVRPLALLASYHLNCMYRQVKPKIVNPLPSRRSARLQERLGCYVEGPDNSFTHQYSAPLGYPDQHVSFVLFV